MWRKLKLTGGSFLFEQAARTPQLPEGLRATLFDGMTGTPSVGSVFNLAVDMKASISVDAKVKLEAVTEITLFNGNRATIAADTQVMLGNDAQLTLPVGTQVTLLRSQPRPVLYEELFSKDRYNPSDLVRRPYPVKDLDFTYGGAYSVYNWELFYHVPFTIAVQLSKNQRFAEAQRWFHFLFDPTDDSDGPTPERFWKVRPFQTTDVKKAEEILVNLATGADESLFKDTVKSIEAWQNAPFRPHVIARVRPQAYMYKTVMAYLDNLIAWGDSLFRQDTGEAIDEAMMLYVLAANILGPRPQPVPKKGAVRPQTYANLRAELEQFGVVVREVEASAPFDLMPFPQADGGNNDRLAPLRSLGKALYFCVPRNDKLLSYWDTVADRLFKVRNSLNLQGIFRQLPLFEPPIDPALLARATAAGLDVGAVVNGLHQPLPLVRFQLLVQKAAEICQEVKSLGNNLLAAMEKEDGEAMAILRAKHERTVMEMVEHVRYAQVQEAIKSKEGLLQSLALALFRYTYYERQLGKKLDEIKNAVPELADLTQDEKNNLEKMMFTISEPQVGLREIEVDIAQDLNESGGKIISSFEQNELAASHSARDWQVRASTTATLASLSYYIPTVGVHLQPFGPGGSVSFGGQHIGPAFQAISQYQSNLATQDSYDAAHAGKLAGFQKREQDWAFQSNLAAGEISQIFKQIRAAQLRVAIAELELKNHRQQITYAKEIEHYLNEEGTAKTGKETNKALYTWIKREVKGLYGQCFQFAFDIAKKAERALQHELGNPELSFLQFGYLAGKEGLLAGEKLYLDIKRMEMAHLELNQREYELTKQVSLLQVDPVALLQLRATGQCTVKLPEELFDMDGPGHYFRRIKTVAVSIPCVTGPYTSVNCTLTLLNSRIRKSPLLRGDDGYSRENAEDDRFNEYFGSLQSIVTSSAQNDSGMFETNLRDERYLPFENSGVVGEWQLQLPANPSKNEPCQFDYDTISDVILQIRYTAREAGSLLRKGAIENLKTAINAAQAVGSVRLFSVRHEFPSEWARFRNQTPDANQRIELTLELREEHYPFWSKGRLDKLERVDMLARSTAKATPSVVIFNGTNDTLGTLTKDTTLGNLLAGPLTNVKLKQSNDVPEEKPTGELKLVFEKKALFDGDDHNHWALADLWIVVTWSGEETT